MKLLLCKKCQDVVRLTDKERKCECGEVRGKYLDDLNAEYSGDTAIPIGFHNSSLVEAVSRQPSSGWGEDFKAFVIPKECPTFKKIAVKRNKNKK